MKKPKERNIAQSSLKTYFKEEEVTKTYHVYKTDFHEVRITNTRIETFLRSIRAHTKKGPRYSSEKQHMKMCRFVIERAKPTVDKLNGQEYEDSIKSLYKSLFKENYDRDDFDNTELETDATREKVAV